MKTATSNIKRHEVTQRLVVRMSKLLQSYVIDLRSNPLFQPSSMSLYDTVWESYTGKIYFKNRGNSSDIAFVDIADSLL